MFIYAIANNSNNVNIFYSSTLAEVCLEFNKHCSFDDYCIKRYEATYDDDITSENYHYVLHACGAATKEPDFNLKRCFNPDDDIDKGYDPESRKPTTLVMGVCQTTTMERERSKHTNPKFRKFHEQMQKHDALRW